MKYEEFEESMAIEKESSTLGQKVWSWLWEKNWGSRVESLQFVLKLVMTVFSNFRGLEFFFLKQTDSPTIWPTYDKYG